MIQIFDSMTELLESVCEGVGENSWIWRWEV